MKSKLDAVTRPDYYYNNGKSEIGPLDYAEMQDLSIAQHAIIKYTTRAGRKPGNSALKDYKQARFYLDRLIAVEEATASETLRGSGCGDYSCEVCYPEKQNG